MGELRTIFKHPMYKRLNSVSESRKAELLQEIKSVEQIIKKYNISGIEVVNGYGDGHYKECSQANVGPFEDFDFVDSCVCCTISRKVSAILFSFDELQKSMPGVAASAPTNSSVCKCM